MVADITNEPDPLDLATFMREYLSDFKPFAYFDKHLDCIRVQIKDCSITERRLSRMLTILEANHTAVQTTVGFTIKGVRHLFEEFGFERGQVLKVTEFIDAIVENYPHSAVKAVEEFAVACAKDMEIDFSDMEAEAA